MKLVYTKYSNTGIKVPGYIFFIETYFSVYLIDLENLLTWVMTSNQNLFFVSLFQSISIHSDPIIVLITPNNENPIYMCDRKNHKHMGIVICLLLFILDLICSYLMNVCGWILRLGSSHMYKIYLL